MWVEQSREEKRHRGENPPFPLSEDDVRQLRGTIDEPYWAPKPQRNRERDEHQRSAAERGLTGPAPCEHEDPPNVSQRLYAAVSARRHTSERSPAGARWFPAPDSLAGWMPPWIGLALRPPDCSSTSIRRARVLAAEAEEANRRWLTAVRAPRHAPRRVGAARR